MDFPFFCAYSAGFALRTLRLCNFEARKSDCESNPRARPKGAEGGLADLCQGDRIKLQQQLFVKYFATNCGFFEVARAEDSDGGGMLFAILCRLRRCTTAFSLLALFFHRIFFVYLALPNIFALGNAQINLALPSLIRIFVV